MGTHGWVHLQACFPADPGSKQRPTVFGSAHSSGASFEAYDASHFWDTASAIKIRRKTKSAAIWKGWSSGARQGAPPPIFLCIGIRSLGYPLMDGELAEKRATWIRAVFLGYLLSGGVMGERRETSSKARS